MTWFAKSCFRVFFILRELIEANEITVHSKVKDHVQNCNGNILCKGNPSANILQNFMFDVHAALSHIKSTQVSNQFNSPLGELWFEAFLRDIGLQEGNWIREDLFTHVFIVMLIKVPSILKTKNESFIHEFLMKADSCFL